MKRRDSFTKNQFFSKQIFRVFTTVFEIFVVPKGAKILDLGDINRFVSDRLYN